MTNPLLQKYEELYGKKEEPKPQKTHAEELKELGDTSCVPANTPNIITAKNVSTSFKTFDPDDLKISFQQVAEQLQTSRAQVLSMSMEMGYPIGECYTSKTLTFEVRVYD
jgi:hypothetical protein